MNAWRVLQNVVVTRDNYVSRGVVLESSLCVVCGEEDETISHLFFNYKIA